MTEIQTEIKAIKEAVSTAKKEIKAHFVKSIPIAKQEFKVLWQDAWEEYKVLCATADAEAELKKQQKAIDTLAIHAQLEIDELNVNYHNFYK